MVFRSLSRPDYSLYSNFSVFSSFSLVFIFWPHPIFRTNINIISRNLSGIHVLLFNKSKRGKDNIRISCTSHKNEIWKFVYLYQLLTFVLMKMFSCEVFFSKFFLFVTFFIALFEISQLYILCVRASDILLFSYGYFLMVTYFYTISIITTNINWCKPRCFLMTSSSVV